MNSKLSGHAPVLLMKDVEQSAHRYKEKPGFEVFAYYGVTSNFSIIQRDNNFVIFCKC